MDMSNPTEGTLAELFQISDTVRAGLAELRRELRQLDAAALEERLVLLEQARDRVRSLAKAHSLEVGDVREKIERCVSDVDEGHHYAFTALQRKRRWENNIEPHVKAIKAGGARVRELRTKFFETKRALDADAVAQLKQEVEGLHRVSLEALNLLQIEDIPGGLRGRLKRDVEFVGAFLSEAQRSVEVKAQWEAGQASNAMAMEQLVSELEAFARGGGDPKEVARRVKRAIGDLDRRRPLDGELKVVFEKRISAVGQGASAAIEEARGAHRERVNRARERFKRIISDLEELIGPPPPKKPRAKKPQPPATPPVDASPEATEPQAPEATEPQAPEATEPQAPEATEPQAPEATEPQAPEATEPQAPEATEPQAPEATEPQAPEATEPQAPEATEPQAPEATEPQAPEITEPKEAPIPLPQLTPKEAARATALEKELKEGLRLAPLGKGELRRLQRETAWVSRRMKSVRKAALEHHTAQVEADVSRVLERAKSGNVKGILNEIQALQRSMNKAPIPWKLKDVHRVTLREAWGIATARIEGAKAAREAREVGRLKGLARHLERWESRIDGLNRLIPRTEERLEFQERRGEYSTSIGGKLLAVKNRAKLEEKIKELRETREELLKKIADVRPMLEAAGYPWPEGQDPDEPEAPPSNPDAARSVEAPPQEATEAPLNEATQPPRAEAEAPSPQEAPSEPASETPEVGASEVDTSLVDTPEVDTPEVDTPEVDTPEVDTETSTPKPESA